ncbi:hypothetical protein AB0885_22790, partial [Streptomyces sp. NPDC005534]
MRKLIAGSFVTLDNVVQDPGGFGEIDRGGWALEYFDEASRRRATDALLASDTFLLGRATYETLEKAWSNNTGPYAEAMSSLPKVVVTNTSTPRQISRCRDNSSTWALAGHVRAPPCPRGTR